MRILYLSQSYVPSRRADSVQVMKMCAALARRGHALRLTTKASRRRQERGVEDDFDFYGVEPRFPIHKLPRPAFRGGGLSFALCQAWTLARSRRQTDLVISRDLAAAWLATRLGYRTIYESHGLPGNRLARRLLGDLLASPALVRLVLITHALARLHREAGYDPGAARTFVAPDAADPMPAREPATRRDGTRPRIGYVGHLYPGRGIRVVASLAERLPQADFHLVGGHPERVAEWRARAARANLLFHGFVPPAELPRLYREFDVVLMPYQRKVGVQSGRSDTSSWMSPMKMFEYMAAGLPIVSSDLPVLREVLEHRRNALLVPPDDVDAWQTALESLLSEPALAERLGRTARDDLTRRYTFDARAEALLEGLERVA